MPKDRFFNICSAKSCVYARLKRSHGFDEVSHFWSLRTSSMNWMPLTTRHINQKYEEVRNILYSSIWKASGCVNSYATCRKYLKEYIYYVICIVSSYINFTLYLIIIWYYVLILLCLCAFVFSWLYVLYFVSLYMISIFIFIIYIY